MTATASAGFNYMQEGIGYAVSSEIPMVIVDVMRCRGENYATQSDVMQMRWGASGDQFAASEARNPQLYISRNRIGIV